MPQRVKTYTCFRIAEKTLFGEVDKVVPPSRDVDKTMYWVRVDGAKEGYYPHPILRYEDELTLA